MTESGLTHVVVALKARQLQFVARQASSYECSMIEAFYDFPTPGAALGRVAAIDHMRQESRDGMLA